MLATHSTTELQTQLQGWEILSKRKKI
jgi:hypothetical protein